MIYTTIDLGKLYPAASGGFIDVYCHETKNDPPKRKYPAMIIVPGGGYAFASKCEAEPIMAAFFSAGVQSFVLRYAAVQSDPPVRYPSEHIQLAAAFDYVRKNADEFKIDKNAVGVIGFSAGGHLAGSYSAGLWRTDGYAETLGVDADNLRPNAAALCYGVLSFTEPTNEWTVKNLLGEKKNDADERARLSYENIVGENTPPTFLWHTSTDDIVPVECSIKAMASLASHKIPFQAHIFPECGHGISRATRLTQPEEDLIPPAYIASWMGECTEWFLRTVGYSENTKR